MTTIKEDYVSFETAKLLKEKGFDEDIDLWYDENGEMFSRHKYDISNDWRVKAQQKVYLSPTLQMAMKWLREVHKIDIDINAEVGMLGVKVYIPFVSTYKKLKDAPSKVRQIKRGIYYKDDKGVISALQHFDSYEEAVETALKYSLENLI